MTKTFYRAGLLSLSFVLLSCSAPSTVDETPARQADDINEVIEPVRKSTGEVLQSMTDDDWRDMDQDNTLYMTLANDGVIIMELAPQFAPNHAANIKTLVSEKYFDGLFVIRSHDNYVAQWGEAETDSPRSLGTAIATLAPEWDSVWSDDLSVTMMPDGDIYQPDAGYAFGFPVAGNKAEGRIGMAHCYGMVGVGRGGTADSGNGSSLYVVTGHSPRHLDRNVTLVGRVWRGVEHLSSLPRGTGPLGFYETADEYMPVTSIRLGSELSEDERVNLQIMRTDRPYFAEYIEARRYRSEEWFLDPAGAVELCNIPMQVREKP